MNDKIKQYLMKHSLTFDAAYSKLYWGEHHIWCYDTKHRLIILNVDNDSIFPLNSYKD